MTTNIAATETSALWAPNPFASANNQVQLCWALGYHDGMNGINPETGKDALVTFAIDARESVVNREGERAASVIRLEQLTAEKCEASNQILPTFANHSIGFWPHFMVAIYLILAVIAVIAEFPLSGLTVGGSLQIATAEQMRAFQALTVWALAVMLCLVGFSIKLIVDVVHSKKEHHWLEVVFAVLALILSVGCIVSVAQLRGAMGAEQIAERKVEIASSATSAQDRKRQLELATNEFNEAHRIVSGSAARTFMLVTIALPCFSAVCLVVAFHQIRHYRKHNKAIKTLNRISEPLNALAESQARLTATIQADGDRLKQLEKDDPDCANFEKWAVAVYRHGFETGAAARSRQLEKEPLYSRLLARLSERVMQC